MIKSNKEIVKSSVFVSLITAAGLVIGFLSQVLIAFYFGTSREFDRFLVAYAFPSVFIGMAGAVFSSCLIPIVTPIKNEPDAMKKAVSTAFFLAMATSLCIAVFGFFGRSFILRATTNLSQDDLAMTITLGGMVWVIAGITILTSFISAVYQLTKSFVLPAVMFLLPTTGRILGTVIFADKFGIKALILGEMIFSFLALLVMLPIIFKYVTIPVKIDFGVSLAGDFLKAMVPVAVSMAPFTILPTIDAFWVSGLSAGSMSYIGYSTRITVALSALVINGIYMVILPYLSEDISNNNNDLFLSRLSSSIKAVLMFFIPIGFFCIFYRYQLIDILFKRGQFTQTSVNEVASVLPFYLLGLIGMGPAVLISRAYCAKREFMKFGIISAALVVMYFISAGLLSKYFSFIGIGITYLVFWLMLFIIGAVLLDKRVLSPQLVAHSLKTAFSAVLCVASSFFLTAKLTFLGTAGVVLLALASSCVLFGIFCYMLKIDQALFVMQHIYGRWHRRIAAAR